jgi:hypothetical protein
MMQRLLLLGCAAWLGLAADTTAALTGKDRDKAEHALYQTLYLRVHAPTTRRSEPVLEISPEGCNLAREPEAAQAADSGSTRSSGVYWPFRPNDVVQWGKAKYQDDTITVWFEGARDELRVRFVGIKTFDDFKRAFKHAFSRVPLHEEHDDWPAEVATAVEKHRLIEGMTPEQASCVAGLPVKVETTRIGDAELVIWFLRQETEDPRKGRAKKTGLPTKVVFENGTLTTIVP